MPGPSSRQVVRGMDLRREVGHLRVVLVFLALPDEPRREQSVAFVPRDHVNVKVRDALAHARVRRDERAFSAKRLLHRDRGSSHGRKDRRELVERGLRFDEKFKFYRTADIELSFQVKAMGLRATVTPIEVTRHEHRMWSSTPEIERDRLSKRNFYRFLDTWRGRTDLLVSRSTRR